MSNTVRQALIAVWIVNVYATLLLLNGYGRA